LLCITDELCAVLKLDNTYVGQTHWAQVGNKCWQQQFNIDLDKVLIAPHLHIVIKENIYAEKCLCLD
jgi:hypothetical protein